MLHGELHNFVYLGWLCASSSTYGDALVNPEFDDDLPFANECVNVSRIVVVGVRDEEHPTKSLRTHACTIITEALLRFQLPARPPSDVGPLFRLHPNRLCDSFERCRRVLRLKNLICNSE
jgi:hypothetical protein